MPSHSSFANRIHCRRSPHARAKIEEADGIKSKTLSRLQNRGNSLDYQSREIAGSAHTMKSAMERQFQALRQRYTVAEASLEGAGRLWHRPGIATWQGLWNNKEAAAEDVLEDILRDKIVPPRYAPVSEPANRCSSR